MYILKYINLVLLTCSLFVFEVSPSIKRDYDISKQYLKALLPIDPIIVEAGAWDGNDTLEMGDIWPTGTIHTFEPVPSLNEILKERVKPFKNIHSYTYALSDKNGITQFYISSGTSTASSSLLAPKEHLEAHPTVYFNQIIDVETITLDAWAEKYNISRIDLLWLDIQGAELKVLKASPKILKTVKAIYTEVSEREFYEKNSRYNDIKEWAEKNDFALAWEGTFPDYGGNVLFIKK